MMLMLLPKEVRREVNAAAHRMGLRYEAELRDSLLAGFIDDMNNGATVTFALFGAKWTPSADQS